MKELKEVIRNIYDELEDAEKYAKAAVRVKTAQPELASVYYRLANEEMGHMETLHKQATEMIEAVKRTGREVPVEMRVIWEWEHEKMMDEAADVKRMLEMYKG